MGPLLRAHTVAPMCFWPGIIRRVDARLAHWTAQRCIIDIKPNKGYGMRRT